MYTYTIVQWFLFFYIYCFLGWVWESSYVSLKQRKWVNRGFMHGPFLPIYGSGAIMVLVSTLPVKDNLVLVFLFGMIGATALEYFTGVYMEKIFNVRYWDYSKKPFNLNGHICLVSSLAWGVFSVGMETVLHHPIEEAVFALSGTMTDGVTLGLTIAIVIDMTQSFNEAMDLKEILISMTESSEEIKYMKQRLETVMMRIDENTKEIRVKAGTGKQYISERVFEEKKKYEDILKEQKEKTAQKSIAILNGVADKVHGYMEEISTRLGSKEKEVGVTAEVDNIINELKAIKQGLAKQEKCLVNFEKKQYFASIKLLKRNPGAISKKYTEALKQLQSSMKMNNKEQ